MKKCIFPLVTISLAASSLGAYAAMPTGAAPFQVVIPNIKSGLELIVEGLYLQPSNSDLDYSRASSHIAVVKPNSDFGFRAGLGYAFPNSGNDVQLAWTHFNHNTTAATAFPYPGSPATLNETDASDVKFKYDALDLDVGQYINMGTRLQTRFFIGLRGVQLQNNMNTTQTVANSQGTAIAANDVFNSKFTGMGPRFGVDTSYHIGNRFGLGIHFATALLVGQVASSMTSSATLTPGNATVSETGVNATTVDNRTRVVPSLDGKVGFNYTIPFKRKDSSMTVEAGYQVTQYFDAIDRVHAGSVTTPSATTFTTSGVGFNGPYLNLNFKI